VPSSCPDFALTGGRGRAKDSAIGDLFRAKAASLGVLTKLPKSPDVAALAVEVAFGCFRHGCIRDRKIVIAYLLPGIDGRRRSTQRHHSAAHARLLPSVTDRQPWA